MNRGFKTYYKEGIKSAALTLKKKENFIKYYVHAFMNFIGRILFFVLAPIFDLSNVRLAKMVRRDKTIDISNTFKGSDNPKSIWTAIVSSVLSVLMFIGGLFVFIVVEAIVVLIGLLFMYISNYNTNVATVITIILSVPVVIGLIIYMIVFPLYFSPMTYVIDTIDGVGSSVAISKSIEAMRRSGKKTVFGIYFVTGLINFGYLLITSLLVYIFISHSTALIVIGIIIAIVALIVYLRFAPVICLGAQVGYVSLCEDLVVDKYNENKVAKGVYVKSTKAMKNTVEDYQGKLIKMFDSVEDVDISLLQMNDIREVNIPKKKEVVKNDAQKIEEFTEDDLKNLLKENNITDGDDKEIEIEETPYEEIKEEIKEPFKDKAKRVLKKVLLKTWEIIKWAAKHIAIGAVALSKLIVKLVTKLVNKIKEAINNKSNKEEKVVEVKIEETSIKEEKEETTEEQTLVEEKEETIEEVEKGEN